MVSTVRVLHLRLGFSFESHVPWEGETVSVSRMFSEEIILFQLKTCISIKSKVCCLDHERSLDNYLRQHA